MSEGEEVEKKTRREWATGFCRQARSDWNSYKRLQGQPVPRSEGLLHLQMATEKLAKAGRLLHTEADSHTLTHSHVGLAKFINIYMFSSSMLELHPGKKRPALISKAKYFVKVAQVIERLAPAVDQARTQSNTEYPWRDESTGKVIVPIDYDFHEFYGLDRPKILAFLKLVDRIFNELERELDP